MVTEKGIVTKTGTGTAVIKTKQSHACESCSAKSGCHSLGGGSEEMEVEVINPVGADVGDTVVIAFETGNLIKLASLVYILPIISMIAGAVLGRKLGPGWGWNPDNAAVFLCFVCLGASFLIIKATGKKMAAQSNYRPKIIRISKHQNR